MGLATKASQKKYLAVIETAAQAKQFLKTEYSCESTILAWTPAASNYLQKHDVNHITLKTFLNHDEINSIGAELIRSINFIAEKMDTLSIVHFKNTVCEGFQCGAAAWYEMKVLLSSYLTTAVVLRRAEEEISPEKVIVYDGKIFEEVSLSYVKPHLNCLFREILCHQNTGMILLKNKQDFTKYFGGLIAKTKEKAKFFVRQVSALKKLLSKPSRGAKKLIVFFQNDYSLPYLHEYFQEKGDFQPMFLNEVEFSKTKNSISFEKFLSSILNEAGIQEHLQLFEVNLTGYFRKYIQTGFKRELVKSLGYLAWFEQHKKDILFIVNGSAFSIPNKFLLHLAHKEAIKRFVITHGTYVGYYLHHGHHNLTWYYNDILWHDKILAPGPGDKSYLDDSFGFAQKTVSTGSIVLERLNQKKPSSVINSKKIILYPISSMNYLNYIGPIRDRTAFEQDEILRAFLKNVRLLSDYKFVIKPPPGSKKLFEKYLQFSEAIMEMGISNVEVIDNPLKEIIHRADFFILDQTSTMLLEMLTTDKPIIFLNVYHPRIANNEKWNIAKLSFWKKRVIVVNSLEEIENNLAPMIKENMDRSFTDLEFLEKYGIHKDDGKCLDRMVDSIKEEVQLDVFN